MSRRTQDVEKAERIKSVMLQTHACQYSDSRCQEVWERLPVDCDEVYPGLFIGDRNYKRKTSYRPMPEELFETARQLISKGVSIRKAAIEIGYHESTLRARLKLKNTDEKQVRNLGRYKPTFTTEQEREIVEHCVQLDKRYFGVTLKSLRFLLFEFAEKNKIPHQFKTDTQLAGRDFTPQFMRRNRLSLRVPRKTSIARTMGFNRGQVSDYFRNLENAMAKYNFSPQQIYNMDETGVQTIPNKLPKHVAPTGKRDVSKTVAAEQGQTVTTVCAMNAVGQYVPPFFIFARKRMNTILIKGGPIGCDMAVTDKGYITAPVFITWLKHFKKYTNPTENHPILLIVDNHVSHTRLDGVTFAKKNHIHLLTLPPHSSHKTQPLDRNFFGPLKSYYNAAVDTWNVSHPGEVFNAYNVAETFKVAFEKAGTIENAINGFRATGIYPLDPNLFTDVDFLPAEVTDQDAPDEGVENEGEEEKIDDDDRYIAFDFLPTQQVSFKDTSKGGDPPQSSQEDQQPSTSYAGSTCPTEDGCTSVISPADIIPLPKIQIKRKRSGKGLKSVLLTSTPHKEKLEQEERERQKEAAEKEKRLLARKARRQLFPPAKPQKKKKKQVVSESSSSESEGAMSLHNSSSDYDSLLLEASSLLEANDHAVVKVEGKNKNSYRHYVAKILSVYPDGYEVVFYKRLQNTFKFSETNEEAFVDNKAIVLKLSKAIESNNARFHKMISFSEDLSELSIY